MTAQDIKKKFMAYRNGMVADALRKAGMPYKVIFGLNVPQLSEIARGVIADREVLAEHLWGDTSTRESRLLACWLFDPEPMPVARARALMESVQTREEADILAFRLLRRLPYAAALAEETAGSPSALTAYASEALRRNLDAL